MTIISSKGLKFFKRFRDFHTSNSWCVGHERWDGIKIIPSQNVRIFGMGLFEKHPSGGAFKIGFKYKLLDDVDNVTFQSETFEEEINYPAEEVTEHIIKHNFINLP